MLWALLHRFTGSKRCWSKKEHFMLRILILLPLALFSAALTANAAHGPVQANVSVCFTPGPESCADVIADEIDAAHSTIRVQAYWLTSATIVRALGKAKRRGIDVQAILDKSQDRRDDPKAHYSSAIYLVHAGIPVWIDDQPAIAHNKVLIIDGHLVVTGSYNFTKSADTRNVENVVVIDSPEVARWFATNWEERRAVSRRFEAE
jgi:phospholipase D